MSLVTYPHPNAADFYPCGCLRNSIGAHRVDKALGGPCPDFETVYPANGSRHLEDLQWKRRAGR